MPKEYVTVSGDTWDLIAYKAFGDGRYTDKIIKENIELRETYVFPAGVRIRLPEAADTVSETLPPWKRRKTQ